MKLFLKVALLFWALAFDHLAFAGVDIFGTVSGMQMAPDGTLWFSISSPANSQQPGTFCANHWDGLNMYIPAGDPNFFYYYGLLMLSLSKSRQIYLGNISIYNGSTPCDITKTGYGIVVN